MDLNFPPLETAKQEHKKRHIVSISRSIFPPQFTFIFRIQCSIECIIQNTDHTLDTISLCANCDGIRGWFKLVTTATISGCVLFQGDVLFSIVKCWPILAVLANLGYFFTSKRTFLVYFYRPK